VSFIDGVSFAHPSIKNSFFKVLGARSAPPKP